MVKQSKKEKQSKVSKSREKIEEYTKKLDFY